MVGLGARQWRGLLDAPGWWMLAAGVTDYGAAWIRPPWGASTGWGRAPR